MVIDKTRNLMGASVIVRDYEGKVMATMCSSMIFIIDPTVAEAFAALKAVALVEIWVSTMSF